MLILLAGQAGSISAPVYVPDIPSDASSVSDVLNTNLDILLKTTTSLVDTNVQTLSAVKSISAVLSNVFSSVKSIATALTDGIKGLTNVVAISAGYYHSLAIRSDGTVWTWGSNHSGQLGDGTTINRYTPVQVQNLTLQ